MSYPNNRSSNPRTSTRFGFGDWDMAFTAQGGLTTFEANPGTGVGFKKWYDEGKRYQTTNVCYLHPSKSDTEALGDGFRRSGLLRLLDYARPDIESGAVQFLGFKELVARDGTNRVPF